MATAGDAHTATNGVNGSHKPSSRFDPNLTPSVINATGPKANPRLKKLISSLVQHLHDFCRENEVTIDEYMMGINMVGSIQRTSYMINQTLTRR